MAVSIVRQFMPLRSGSRQNSPPSTTQARNYNQIILLSSSLNDVLASTKLSHYSPARSLRRQRRVRTSQAWTRSQHRHLLQGALKPIFIRNVCGLLILLKGSSHYRKGLPILAPLTSDGPEVVTPVYSWPTVYRIRISSNVTSVELAVALDFFWT